MTRLQAAQARPTRHVWPRVQAAKAPSVLCTPFIQRAQAGPQMAAPAHLADSGGLQAAMQHWMTHHGGRVQAAGPPPLLRALALHLEQAGSHMLVPPHSTGLTRIQAAMGPGLTMGGECRLPGPPPLLRALALHLEQAGEPGGGACAQPLGGDLLGGGLRGAAPAEPGWLRGGGRRRPSSSSGCSSSGSTPCGAHGGMTGGVQRIQQTCARSRPAPLSKGSRCGGCSGLSCMGPQCEVQSVAQMSRFVMGSRVWAQARQGPGPGWAASGCCRCWGCPRA